MRRSRASFKVGVAVLALVLLPMGCQPIRDADPAEHARERADAAPLPQDALPSLEQSIAAREYQASRTGAELQAPNRAQNLRTYFAPTGIRVHDRTAPGSPVLVSMELRALGRGESSHRVEPGEVTSEAARVEIARPGLVEWYENSPEGLEQGFTLETRPDGDRELWLELELSGVSVQARGDAIDLVMGTGQRLRYAKLRAHDASGAELQARMEVSGSERLRLVIADAGAAYPLTLDPLLSRVPDAQLESDQDSAQLGTSVATAGDVNGDGYADVIVGAPGYDAGTLNEGAAFVFLGSAAGIASGGPAAAATQLESNQDDGTGGLFGIQFGYSVASAGDVNGDGYADVIVGAPNYSAGQAYEGAAFVFLGSASGIADGSPATAATQLESNQAGALGVSGGFGWSVASAGDVNGDGYTDVIVGAPNYDAGQTDEGAAFVFLGSASGVASGNPATAATRIESNQANAALGSSVASAGDVNGDGYADVIVGAVSYDAGQTDEGAAFVFVGSASGIASGSPATAATLLESNQASVHLGSSVASAGDVNGDGYADVIVGAPSSPPTTQAGAAYVFLGSASGIANGNPSTAATRLVSVQSGALFGSSVASAGDVNGDGYADVIVGAPHYSGVEAFGGAAFVFLGSISGIASGDPAAIAATRFEGSQSGDIFNNAGFGRSVGSAGDVNGDGYSDVIVGAPTHDAGQTNEGAAFVYQGGGLGIASGTPKAAATQLVSTQAGAEFGNSVASAGDVNGDGYADVIVGAPGYDAGTLNEGAAFVFLGRGQFGIANGSPATAAAQLVADRVRSGFGASVASAGDVNGDGYADVIVGAPAYDSSGGTSEDGAAFVFLGSANGIANGGPATAAARLVSTQAGAEFGDSVASAGDVNGDGYADVIVGSPNYSVGQAYEGAAFVFLGSANGIASGGPATAAARLESDQANAFLGISVAGAGDVNGDGYADVIVGASSFDAGQTDEGAAFVFLGGPGGIAGGNPATAAAQLESDQASAFLGNSVAGAGDVNGDGYADVIVGASSFDAGQTDEGAAFVFLGGPGGIADGNPATAAAQLESDQASAFLGSSVAGAGDVNGDGYADVIVGASRYAGGQTDEGAAFVFLGGPGGVADGNPATAAAQLESNQAGAFLGNSVAGAGDVNGDGFADVIVGAYQFTAGQTKEGGAFVFQSNRGAIGRLAEAIQPPVAPWGVSLPNLIQLGMYVFNPEGRGAVNVAAEACPAGVPFGSPSCRSAFAGWRGLLGTPGAAFLGGPRISGLNPGTLYHWRARELLAPLSVTKPGIVPPPHPAHGPWRRLNGQLVEADIRTDTDVDLDGIGGRVDNCPLVANSSQQNSDGDLLGNACDNCPFYATANTTDTDGDGRGNECECGDQTGDGRNNVLDLIAINLAIFNPSQVTPLCDANNDGRCNVKDIVAVNTEIFSPGNTSTCARQPVPGPVGADSDGDAVLDAFDNCPFFANGNQLDTDGDGRGNACECTDQNGDGRNTVSDLVAINTAIFNPTLATPLCDGNNDGKCDVNDIVAANVEIFAPKSSICAGQPFPGP